jgi:trimethylamine--corrinoid protein Co-methyltransferase
VSPEHTHAARAGQFTYLTEQNRQDIYDAALHIIGEIGMRVHHPEALELLRHAGCPVTDENLVRIPPELVAKARETAPSHVHVFGRDGLPAMDLGGRNSYFGTGSDLMSIYDLETGEHRPSTLADVGRAARLCDALPNIDFIMSCAYPNDVDPHRAFVESFRAMSANCTKPLVMTSENAGDLEVMWEMACALRGGAEELRAKPYFTMYLEPVSPLEHAVEATGKLLFCADWGIPAIYSPAPLAGGTAPITVAGHPAQGTAESLFGLVIHQLRRPGAPFIFGIGPAVLDMATSQSSYNAPEYLMTFLCAVEMARWLDLPNWGYGGTSDSQLVDTQAGLEAAELAFICLSAGSNLNHDVGYLDFGLSGALEMVVIVDEYVSLNRRLFAGVEVTPETLAIETIAAVGPGGEFLSAPHTARHVRTAQWRPTIINRKGRPEWEKDGAPDLREKARRKALHLLETHQPTPLADGTAEIVDALAAEFRPA